jgi:hypothetical protein
MTSELTTTANLPLQRQRCRRLERFLKVEEIIFFSSKRTRLLMAL